MNKFIVIAWVFLLPCIAHATISGQPMGAAPCADGGENVMADAYKESCTTSRSGDEDGVWMYGPGQLWLNKHGNSYIGQWLEYVPHSGKYKMRAYICEVAKPTDGCTSANSIDAIDTLYTYIKATDSISDNHPDFGGPTKTLAPLPFPTKMCYALIDEAGQEYKSSEANSCRDAEPLPDHPVKCNLDSANLNISVDVQRGQLMPSATQGRGVTKQLQMTCEADTSASFKISLSANKQIEIENGTAVGTSTNGLGIALYYNDKLLSPGTDLSAEFVSGATPINLEFVPVRDPSIPVNKISTGDYSADAVLVMTEQ